MMKERFGHFSLSLLLCGDIAHVPLQAMRPGAELAEYSLVIGELSQHILC